MISHSDSLLGIESVVSFNQSIAEALDISVSIALRSLSVYVYPHCTSISSLSYLIFKSSLLANFLVKFEVNDSERLSSFYKEVPLISSFTKS